MTQASIFISISTDKGTESGPGDTVKDETWVLPRGVYAVVRDSRHMCKKIAIKRASCLVPGEFRE